MGADGVGDVTDVDGVQMLVVTRLLDEDLLENNCFIKAVQRQPGCFGLTERGDEHGASPGCSGCRGSERQKHGCSS